MCLVLQTVVGVLFANIIYKRCYLRFHAAMNFIEDVCNLAFAVLGISTLHIVLERYLLFGIVQRKLSLCDRPVI
jgi:hypothetical protein